MLLSIQNIDKHFFAVHAVNDVSMEIKEGEIVSLIGENGAGKSTLAKMIAGVHYADTGNIVWNSTPLDIHSHTIAKANHMGISMIFQETNLVPHLNVAENIFLGREPRKLPYIIDYPKLYQMAKEQMEKLNINVDLETPVYQLAQAYKQQVEILKALSFNAKLIIMDEPTSSLAIHDTQNLLKIVKQLKQDGISVLYISHKLEEVLEISDRIIVMRDGKIVEEKPAGEMDKEKMIKAMIGRDLKFFFPKVDASAGEEILRVENLKNSRLSEPVSFKLCRGEVLGFAGLIGAGRTELMHSLWGILPMSTGEIYLEGKRIRIRSPEEAMEHGIGFVPEDRREQGLILQMMVGENAVLSIMKRLSRYWVRQFSKEENTALDSVEKLSIKTSSIEQKVLNLSGGNQQKIVLAKWLLTAPKVLILDEPTRGIDVGAKAEVHTLIRDLAKNGLGVILVSSEMEEIIGMCDRVIVMRKGSQAGELPHTDISEESIMRLAAHSS